EPEGARREGREPRAVAGEEGLGRGVGLRGLDEVERAAAEPAAHHAAAQPPGGALAELDQRAQASTSGARPNRSPKRLAVRLAISGTSLAARMGAEHTAPPPPGGSHQLLALGA